MSTTKSYKIVYTGEDDKSGTLTVSNAKDGIDGALLSDIADDFEAVGYYINYGYYYTVTKGDKTEPNAE